jgi:hypothetical protein
VITLKPQDELLASLSSNLRSTVRRALRRAETDGIRCRPAEPNAAEHAARRLVALHREMWQGRDIGPEHLTRRFESYVLAAARRMMVRGFGGISEFWRDGEVIISDFWVSGQDFFGTYMLGASQEALRRYQWSSLYIWDALDIARSKNSDHLDLLRGEDLYKLRWSSRVVTNHRLIIGRNRIAWAPYALYHALYSSARLYASSESAPRWVKNTADVYRRILRHVAARYTKGGERP